MTGHPTFSTWLRGYTREEVDAHLDDRGPARPALRRHRSDPPLRERVGAAHHVGAHRPARRPGHRGGVVGERGYQLHVQSRASAWRFARPLLDGFRSSFQPTG